MLSSESLRSVNRRLNVLPRLRAVAPAGAHQQGTDVRADGLGTRFGQLFECVKTDLFEALNHFRSDAVGVEQKLFLRVGKGHGLSLRYGR